MQEIISIHIGQAGVQVGNNCWELFCLEHGIEPNGQLQINKAIAQEKNEHLKVFFHETTNGKLKSRSIFIDLEPSMIDCLKTGKYREIFDQDQLISGNQDANNFARGYFMIGQEYIDIFLDRIRKQVENCESHSGFMIYNSLGGGTGSGLGSLIVERLSIDYCKKTKVGFNIYPSSLISSTVVEPYNSVLAANHLLEYGDLNITLDNEGIFDICRRNLDIEVPKYSNLNRLIAQVISSQTVSLRFKGALLSNINEFQSDLVPYPKIHFMICSYSPLCSKQNHSLNTVEMTIQAFESSNVLAKCDPTNGKYMACSLLYRGDIIPKDVSAAIPMIKRKKTIQFLDWCPTGFKIGINYQQQYNVLGGDLPSFTKSACMISNSTVMATVFSRINCQYDLMFAKRSFVHWFIQEGMEEAQFEEARENLECLQLDYKEIESDHEKNDEAAA